jgi:hypothetical protein
MYSWTARPIAGGRFDYASTNHCSMPRFRFSLWWLMAAITAASVFLFISVSFGGFIAVVIASTLWCIVPTPLVVIAIYGRGDLKAFAIGALIPWVMLISMRYPAEGLFLAASIWLLPLCAICGVLAAATRRWIQPHRD